MQVAWHRALAVAALALPGCGGCRPPDGVPPPEDGGAADAGEAPDAGVDPCAGLPLREPAIVSESVRAFAPGRLVEQTLRQELALTRPEVGFDLARSSQYFPADPATTLAQVRTLQTQALDVPQWALSLVSDVRAVPTNACGRAAGEAIAGALTELDARNNPSAAGLVPKRQEAPDLDALLDPAEPLVAAFRAVYAVDHPWPRRPVAGTFAADEPKVRRLAAEIDATTARTLARVVLGMAKAEEWRLDAVKPWYPNGTDFVALADAFASGSATLRQVRDFDYGALARAGIALGRAVGQLAAHIEAHPLPEGLVFQVGTPLGHVLVNGRRSNNDYSLPAPALVVDQGGADTYRGVVAGPTYESIPLSVVVDVSGNDRYLAPQTDRTQASGFFSFGYLVDLGGDDEYLAQDLSQGSGMFGVGVLYDAAGADRHTARDRSQGSGWFGTGVAIDLGGPDIWNILSFGQGFAYVRSSGLLLDADGDDSYDADDVNILHPSPQTAQHNASMAQGAGFGYRGNDWPDTMSGGTGVLVDLGGNDTYGCGLFCQGAGYWFGHGILYDAGGNDRYRGVWYVQGGSAHFAFGTLIDEAGDDEYVATMNMSQGAGHDGSIGVLIEGGGDDRYALTSLSHGAGNDVGIGFFFDRSGSDLYGTRADSQGIWFGQTASANFAGTVRQGILALGLFLEGAGADTYAIAPPEAKNAATWKLPPQGWAPPEHRGLGVDLE